MRLNSFRVTNFRNIVDSGEIAVDDCVTCLVGKNEAGKSGLLEALYLFNPAHEDIPRAQEQYPRWLMARDRKSGDIEEATLITVSLDLQTRELDAIAELFGSKVLTEPAIMVSRRYDGLLSWTLDLFEEAAVRHVTASFPATIHGYFSHIVGFDALAEQLSGIEPTDETGPSAEDLQLAKDRLAELDLDETWSVHNRITEVLVPLLPTFFRFTNYSTLPGRIDFADLAADSDSFPGQSDLQAARALIRLAGADLKQLSSDEYELRSGELEAVQIDLTQQVFEYWKQNPHLEVSIDVDTEVTRQNNASLIRRFLEIRLKDRRTGYSNNFSQRSSGFQWFFSFLAAFSEFDDSESPIVLLDEPALTLHGRAQADFLRFINERLAATTSVLYTTHSPFMVETDKLERVRIVEDHGPPVGATATSDVLAAEAESLFPLQAALGYDIAQSLFVGPHNLLVEGTSDFIYLTIMSQLCEAAGKSGLDSRWRILPSGGATNIPTFVSLIGPHLDVTVLADSDTQGMQRVTNMVSRNLLKNSRLIFASVATSSPKADIEDLFSEGDYLALYDSTFGRSTKVADLPSGSRVVKRLETLHGKFVHGQVAETLLRDHLNHSFTAKSLDQFSALNDALNATMIT